MTELATIADPNAVAPHEVEPEFHRLLSETLGQHPYVERLYPAQVYAHRTSTPLPRAITATAEPVVITQLGAGGTGESKAARFREQMRQARGKRTGGRR